MIYILTPCFTPTPTNMRFLVSLLSASLAVAQVISQEPLLSDISHHDFLQHDFYEFKWPIRKVAIIGAGPGGLISYREFTQAGFEVRLFERDDLPGGNWHYSEEVPPDAPVPNADPAVGDFVPSLPPKGAILPYTEEYVDEDVTVLLDRRRNHREPKPVWASLKSNAPSVHQQIRETPWPAGTPWSLPHQTLQRYLRAFASWHGINTNDDSPNVSYATRVEQVEKRFRDNQHVGWTLTLKKFVQTGDRTSQATWWTEDFDAVVVATGRYNAPNIPNIEGLAAWAAQFPGSVQHSRQYRRPEPFLNKTVLVVGAGTSGGEVARDLNFHAQKVYLSTRPDKSTVPHFPREAQLGRVPENTTFIGEIRRFQPTSDISAGEVELINGTVITGIDHIIFSTGFKYSFPFLGQYHNSSLGPNDRAQPGTPQPIVTDGTHLRSLHLDVFYIEEPTIGFININVGMQSFSYAEFTSLALAKVWSNKAKIPSTPTLWRLHEERTREQGGYGRHFQFLGAKRNREKIRFFVAWLNDAAVRYGGRQIDAAPSNTEVLAIWAAARYGNANISELSDSSFAPLTAEEKADRIIDIIFSDDW
ncbi:hypothetical protein EDD18DRAFT_176503 [Armillaria luteobubalina]|uniref:FAD/NAD(P)-binding domain-containing protein n=1 Tax=Armillaria luteobubalina TaxID=153913 RepID=A0AA39UNM5_9AGAR|nr:hypothetical protein EDD18DRAFT_176503 [Armillaria luteobubalina]